MLFKVIILYCIAYGAIISQVGCVDEEIDLAEDKIMEQYTCVYESIYNQDIDKFNRCLRTFLALDAGHYQITKNGQLRVMHRKPYVTTGNCAISYSKENKMLEETKLMSEDEHVDSMKAYMRKLNKIRCEKEDSYYTSIKKWYKKNISGARTSYGPREVYEDITGLFASPSALEGLMDDTSHATRSTLRWLGIVPGPSYSERISDLLSGYYFFIVLTILIAGLFSRYFSYHLSFSFLCSTIPYMGFISLFGECTKLLLSIEGKLRGVTVAVALTVLSSAIIFKLPNEWFIVAALVFVSTYIMEMLNNLVGASKENPFKVVLFLSAWQQQLEPMVVGTPIAGLGAGQSNPA